VQGMVDRVNVEDKASLRASKTQTGWMNSCAMKLHYT